MFVDREGKAQTKTEDQMEGITCRRRSVARSNRGPYIQSSLGEEQSRWERREGIVGGWTGLPRGWKETQAAFSG